MYKLVGRRENFLMVGYMTPKESKNPSWMLKLERGKFYENISLASKYLPTKTLITNKKLITLPKRNMSVTTVIKQSKSAKNMSRLLSSLQCDYAASPAESLVGQWLTCDQRGMPRRQPMCSVGAVAGKIILKKIVLQPQFPKLLGFGDVLTKELTVSWVSNKEKWWIWKVSRKNTGQNDGRSVACCAQPTSGEIQS